MLTTFVDHLYLNNLNHRKRAVSSCVTSTPLNLLVTALEGRCDVLCCLLVDACSCLLHSNRCLLVDCFPVFTILCASAGTLRRRCEFAINYTFVTRLINSQGLDRFDVRSYHMFTTSFKPIQPCHL